jgi:hypothetical protein
MQNELEARPSRTPVVRKVAAGLILVVVAAFAIHIVIGLVVTVFWVALGIAVLLAVLWALKTIVW